MDKKDFKYVVAITIRGGVEVVEIEDFNQLIGLCGGLKLSKKKYSIVKQAWYGTSQLTRSEWGLLNGGVHSIVSYAKKIIPVLGGD